MLRQGQHAEQTLMFSQILPVSEEGLSFTLRKGKEGLHLIYSFHLISKLLIVHFYLFIFKSDMIYHQTFIPNNALRSIIKKRKKK